MKLSNAKSTQVALMLAICGLVFIVVGNGFQLELMKVKVDALVTNIGALVLFIGVFQWLFEESVRRSFLSELRAEIVGNQRVSESGILDFHADSKDVDFKDDFISSASLVIGVNYSAKLIDNSIGLLHARCKRGLETTIIVVDTSSEAGIFLEKDYGNPKMEASINKIKNIASDCNVNKKIVKIIETDTVLRYSFVLFDSKAWIVVGTNGKGRRSVPGFYVRVGSPWFQHFEDDIAKLKGDAK